MRAVRRLLQVSCADRSGWVAGIVERSNLRPSCSAFGDRHEASTLIASGVPYDG
jgi:hypothetical protein